MVYACEECAKKENYSSRCSSGGEYRDCYVCGYHKQCDLWSRSSLYYGPALLLEAFLLIIFIIVLKQILKA